MFFFKKLGDLFRNRYFKVGEDGMLKVSPFRRASFNPFFVPLDDGYRIKLKLKHFLRVSALMSVTAFTSHALSAPIILTFGTTPLPMCVPLSPDVHSTLMSRTTIARCTFSTQTSTATGSPKLSWSILTFPSTFGRTYSVWWATGGGRPTAGS